MPEAQYHLQHTMRWYGKKDPVSLRDIAQAGCSGVVTALHDIPVGDVWPVEKIQERKEEIGKFGLVWTVVESLPVHESIKKGAPDAAVFIANYAESLHNLGECGIEVVTYNFMPVLDWVRTDVAFRRPDGAETLLFNFRDFRAFEELVLHPEKYAPEDSALRAYYDTKSGEEKEKLQKTVLLGLPGSDIPFTLDEVRKRIAEYVEVTPENFRANLIAFLKLVAPVARAAGITMAIHPDDPPFSILGLPRIMSTGEDIQAIMDAVPDKGNGLCFCTGSFGARKENDLPAMMRKWGERIAFLHLRNTRRDAYGNFMEAPHLDGDTDMYAVMREAVLLMNKERRAIPMRPDHGFRMLDDFNKNTYPGYSAIGRLKGLAELRGLEMGILRSLEHSRAE